MTSISSGEYSYDARQPWSLQACPGSGHMHPASQTSETTRQEEPSLSAPQQADSLSLPEATPEAGWPLAPALTFSFSSLEIQEDLLVLPTVVASLRPGVSISVEKRGGKKPGRSEEERKEPEGGKGKAGRGKRRRWGKGMGRIRTLLQEEGLGITCCFQGHVTRSVL